MKLMQGPVDPLCGIFIFKDYSKAFLVKLNQTFRLTSSFIHATLMGGGQLTRLKLDGQVQ